MSNEKKLKRKLFRDSVFSRDRYRCRACGFDSKKDESLIDSHHIVDRNLMPNGGYVKENGITLCHPCHEKAEMFHSTGVAVDGYSCEDLFSLIGSSITIATKKAENLC